MASKYSNGTIVYQELSASITGLTVTTRFTLLQNDSASTVTTPEDWLVRRILMELGIVVFVDDSGTYPPQVQFMHLGIYKQPLGSAASLLLTPGAADDQELHEWVWRKDIPIFLAGIYTAGDTVAFIGELANQQQGTVDPRAIGGSGWGQGWLRNAAIDIRCHQKLSSRDALVLAISPDANLGFVPAYTAKMLVRSS